MATIYLDSRSLSDKEDGSKEHPFKYFDFAYKQAKGNDIIWDLEPKVVKLSKYRQQQNIKPIDWSRSYKWNYGEHNEKKG